MFFQQRIALERLLAQRKEGYISRRTFLKQAGEIGLVGGLAMSLLESCDAPVGIGSGRSKPVEIAWQSEDDQDETFAYLVRKFNELHPDIRVRLQARAS